jgi:hypothetical protein
MTARLKTKMEATNLDKYHIRGECPRSSSHTPASKLLIRYCGTNTAKPLLSRYNFLLQLDRLEIWHLGWIVLARNERDWIWKRGNGMEVDEGDEDFVIL